MRTNHRVARVAEAKPTLLWLWFTIQLKTFAAGAPETVFWYLLLCVTSEAFPEQSHTGDSRCCNPR